MSIGFRRKPSPEQNASAEQYRAQKEYAVGRWPEVKSWLDQVLNTLIDSKSGQDYQNFRIVMRKLLELGPEYSDEYSVCFFHESISGVDHAISFLREVEYFGLQEVIKKTISGLAVLEQNSGDFKWLRLGLSRSEFADRDFYFTISQNSRGKTEMALRVAHHPAMWYGHEDQHDATPEEIKEATELLRQCAQRIKRGYNYGTRI